MTSPATEVPGFVVLCDRYATIIEVVHDSLDSGLRAGRGFVEALTTASIPDGLSLLAAVRGGRAINPVVLQLHVPTAATVHVVGAVEDGDGDLVLVGTTRLDDLPSLVGLTPAPVADLARTLPRTGADAQAQAQAHDEASLHALSAANNSLVDLHRELARTNAELTRINGRKDEILATVAHDLRNPLTSIAGFGDALERQLDSVLDDTSRLMLTRIGALSDRMRSLVDDLLDTSAIEHRALTLEREVVDVHRLVADTAANHAHGAAAKQVRLEVDLSGPPLEASVDDDRLAQVVDNLLSNAIKFSPSAAGANVTIGCRRADAQEFCIEVRDEGVGIPPEIRDQLFEPFSSGSRRGTADERGSGLGLAITESIVAAHGGSITVDTEEGRGSTFTVSLPISPPGETEGWPWE